eukprot:COSAG04_NODE_415_length_14711_cov_7.685464_2_plen_119_part_00
MQNDGHNIRFGTELRGIIQEQFPGIIVGEPKMARSGPRPLADDLSRRAGLRLHTHGAVFRSDGTPFDMPPPETISDSTKAKELLGVTLRPAEVTIRDCVESSIELGLITVQLADSPKL